jgi:glucose-1-phosphate cytidylyltransferase
MQKAAEAGEMTICRHEGFWQCMDTSREYQLLNELWKSGNAPWTRCWK